MDLCVFALTEQGSCLAREIKTMMGQEGHAVQLYLRQEFARGEAGENSIDGNLAQLVGSRFHSCDGMVLVMAAGIAVRVIAPHLRDKYSDPAVVVMDEKGRFAISLLSGHLGGANRLAENLGRLLGAAPVITTASDVNDTLALDELAQKKGWRIENPEQMKRVSSALVNGRRVALVVDRREYLEPAPQIENIDLIEIDNSTADVIGTPGREYQAVVFITSRQDVPSLVIPSLVIRPATVVIGVGCRRGASKKSILEAVEGGLRQAGRSLLSARCLSTIDLKRDEQGLLAAAEALGLPLEVFDRRGIIEIESEFPGSEWVKSRVGVGAVCEPAAYLAGKQPRRVLGKTRFNGVTIAVYEDWE